MGDGRKEAPVAVEQQILQQLMHLTDSSGRQSEKIDELGRKIDDQGERLATVGTTQDELNARFEAHEVTCVKRAEAAIKLAAEVQETRTWRARLTGTWAGIILTLTTAGMVVTLLKVFLF